MKILIVSAFPTHPVVAGNIQWMQTQASLLINQGHEVHYLWGEIPNMSWIDPSYLKQMYDFWGNRLHVFYQSRMDRLRSNIRTRMRGHTSHPNKWKCDEIYPNSLSEYVNCLNANYHFDACIVHYFYLTKLFETLDIPIKVLSTHDSFAYRNLRVSENDMYITANDEAKAMRRATHILALQDAEKHYFEHLSPKSKVYTVYNYYPFHKSDITGNHNVLFLSSSNPYNVIGIKWFVDDVLPLVAKDYPDIKLILGGRICDELSMYKEHPNIEFQGFVDNVEKFYLQGDVAINPVYLGTGLKIKTFESLSYDKATIVHPHSLEGVYKKESIPLFCSEIKSEWISYFHKIWDDPQALCKIKDNNQAYIRDMNDFVMKQYSEIFEEKRMSLAVIK